MCTESTFFRRTFKLAELKIRHYAHHVSINFISLQGIQIITDIKTTSFGDDVHENLLLAKRQEESFRHGRRLNAGGFCEARKRKRAGKKLPRINFRNQG
jgi:hypothetical protein